MQNVFVTLEWLVQHAYVSYVVLLPTLVEVFSRSQRETRSLLAA